MATEILKLTAQIVMSHATMSELSPQELVEEIKEVFNVLTSLEGPEGEAGVPEKAEEAGVVKKPPIPGWLPGRPKVRRRIAKVAPGWPGKDIWKPPSRQ